MENKIVKQLGIIEGAVTSLCIVALCGFMLFSPWTSRWIHFWGTLTFVSFVISFLAGHFQPEWTLDVDLKKRNLCLGVALAFVLWGVCWLVGQWAGEFVPAARAQIDAIYGLGKGHNPYLLAVLLFALLGPTEEVFWRGYIQRVLSNRWSPNKGYIVTTLLYALVHVWSFNGMLVLAALGLGLVWGGLYRLNPRWLSPLMLSHALLDVLVFVVLPV